MFAFFFSPDLKTLNVPGLSPFYTPNSEFYRVDTALVAPPERDLWHLASGDGTVPGAYAAATGITPLAELIELYRLGWDVKDTAVDAARFFRPHSDSADDVKTWKLLNMLVSGAGG